jgi:hypothetical protein
MTRAARSLQLLRRQGYLAAPVERFIAQVQRKQDLFGVADVLAVYPRDKALHGRRRGVTADDRGQEEDEGQDDEHPEQNPGRLERQTGDQVEPEQAGEQGEDQTQ